MSLIKYKKWMIVIFSVLTVLIIYHLSSLQQRYLNKEDLIKHQNKKKLHVILCEEDFYEKQMGLTISLYLAIKSNRILSLDSNSLGNAINLIKLINHIKIKLNLEIETNQDFSKFSYLNCPTLRISDFKKCLETVIQHDENYIIKCPKYSSYILETKHDEELFISLLKIIEPNQKIKDLLELSYKRLDIIGAKNYEFNIFQFNIPSNFQNIKFDNQTSMIQKLNLDIKSNLTMKDIKKETLLYLMCDWNLFEPFTMLKLIKEFEKEGYYVFNLKLLIPVEELNNEEIDVFEHYWALRAQKTIGSIQDKKYALIFIKRRYLNLWSSSWTGHSLYILNNNIPSPKIPWVFSHNVLSTRIEYLVKAAVRSANQIGGLDLICLYVGNSTASIIQWLNENNVNTVQVQPHWTKAIIARNTMAKKHLYKSWLYASPEALITTYLRIDIPLIEILKQYDYVFYADTDIYFRRRFTFFSFPQPFPVAVGLGGELNEEFPYNAGVGIWNIEHLQKTYDDFLDFILSNENGLFYKTDKFEYGVVDQGAYNQYYEKSIRNWKLPKTFNSKPYHDFDPKAYLVHIHGMKPTEYYEYLKTGYCRYEGICRDGIIHGVCEYLLEWLKYANEFPHKSEFKSLCYEIVY